MNYNEKTNSDYSNNDNTTITTLGIWTKYSCELDISLNC
jgi:hypothetical protein